MKVEYTNDEILKFIKASKKACSLEFKESSFLTDVENNVPIFIRDGNLTKWAHKSLQDYFAAEWIASHAQKEELIKRIFESKKRSYLNIIDFLYEFESKIFRKIIVLNIIIDFINYCDTTYLHINGVDKKSIKLRQAITFGNGIILVNEKIARTSWSDSMNFYATEFTDYNLSRITQNGTLMGIENWIGQSFYQEVLTLLVDRIDDIFIEHLENVDTINTRRTYSFAIDKKQTLNDEVANVLNLKENFDLVNEYLISRIVFPKMGLLDYSKCLKLKRKIEKEVLSSLESDILSGI